MIVSNNSAVISILDFWLGLKDIGKWMPVPPNMPKAPSKLRAFGERRV